ncbi:GQ67_05152T0 [Komagataella phaffii]|nr:GQ67_05152T0 [Komagataella phaffii]AOA70165.1 GQ68_05134T0 [Komagataella phaffii GS115]CAH2450562.1 Predicted protein [Komagataella phaffii CBS 7435]
MVQSITPNNLERKLVDTADPSRLGKWFFPLQNPLTTHLSGALFAFTPSCPNSYPQVSFQLPHHFLPTSTSLNCFHLPDFVEANKHSLFASNIIDFSFHFVCFSVYFDKLATLNRILFKAV